jgi:helix-turn-helix protein
MNSAKIVVNDKEVVLEIEDVENCRFELWTVGNETTSCVKIKIPDDIWVKLVDEWNKQRGER